MTASGRQPPLAWRLGLIVGAIVLGLLLIAGLVVNRVVSGRFETVLANQQQQRLDDAAATLADGLDRGAGVVRAQNVARRLATNLGGEVRVVAADGTVLAAFGRAPTPADSYVSTISLDGRTLGQIEATLPAGASGRAFLTLFNVTLLLAGLLSAVGIALASVYIAGRLTTPLHDVAAAARRLGAGDTSARAVGGGDRESADLAASFNAMADRLERSEMLRRRAASDIAHDLATPATVLVSQLQAMVDRVVPADAENLNAARSAASALASVVGELNELASAEAAPLQARPTAVDLGAAVREIARALDGLSRERDVRLEFAIPPSTVVFVDPGHLARALRNVMANAIGHSPPAGRVLVASSGGGPMVEVRISDQGRGIAPTELPHIFERFYRVDPARSPDPATGRRTGTGIGLTIAREMLAANGGRIDVEQTGPDGTTFLIALPSLAATRAG
ncbi:MAG: HAMP domain-containing histidine kinase [Chloroflexota bacterium]|nr:HAMP domain-containing histidine kinase [Chloroflexota bacterium]